MSEAPRPEPDAGEQLAAWRREGLWRADPLRFQFLEALATRLAGQPEPLRQRLAHSLNAGLADYAQRLARAREQALEEGTLLAARQPALGRQLRGLQALGDVRGIRRLAAQVTPPPVMTLAPLAQLVDAAAQGSPTLREAQAGAVPGREELSSVRRFRRVWASGRSQDQLARARSRQPVNAGPLNSHALVLQSLALMQELSPDYLRHFMVHVESLQWLEAVRDAPPPVSPKAGKAAKPGKRGKSAKPGKADRAEP